MSNYALRNCNIFFSFFVQTSVFSQFELFLSFSRTRSNFLASNRSFYTKVYYITLKMAYFCHICWFQGFVDIHVDSCSYIYMYLKTAVANFLKWTTIHLYAAKEISILLCYIVICCVALIIYKWKSSIKQTDINNNNEVL